ncbi:hypothetical protein LUZ60_015360 [Juncus effusus]|nr:hypothetical protein LUZ60_015360 [Juncus effusus]
MANLQGWPEPVIPVQNIFESGITTIPEQYIKPPTERPINLNQSLTDKNNDQTVPQLPIIDISGLSSNNATVCRATMHAISTACREWGFFQVVNHGVSLDLVNNVKKVWRAFFELPKEKKQVYANSPVTYEGYGSRTGTEKGAILDWGDYFFLNILPERIKTCDKWPDQHILCREITEEYAHEMVKLCNMLMRVLSLGLGLEVELLQKEFGGDEIDVGLRINYYPKCPQPDLTLGLSAHSDPGGLTVLFADECVAGLQVKNDENWVTVQPAPNAFIINVGDQIQVLSNGIFKSVEHRVLTNSTHDRLSLALFYNPRTDVPLGPLPSLLSKERPPLYRPMTYNEYRMFIRKNGPRGKAQLVKSLNAV